MHNHTFKEKLEQVSLPEVTLPKHQLVLREKLLSTDFSQLPQMSERKGRNIFRRISPVFITVCACIVLMLGYSVLSTTGNLPWNTPQAQARELVKQVMVKVNGLTAEERKILEAQLKDSLQASLEQAQQASDLTVVEAETITESKDDGQSVTIVSIKNKDGFTISEGSFSATLTATASSVVKNLDPQTLTYLKYTDSEGNEVILAITADQLPVFKFVKIKMNKNKLMFMVKTEKNATESGEVDDEEENETEIEEEDAEEKDEATASGRVRIEEHREVQLEKRNEILERVREKIEEKREKQEEKREHRQNN